MTRLIDMTGQQINWLTVIERAPNKGNGSAWLCRCICGNTTSVRRSELTSPKTVSCGCYGKTKNVTHGRSKTRAYFRWHSMISRCHNKNDSSYPRYGERGISVCKQWRNSFDQFLKDVGECPEGLTLDRINSFGDYEPGNVRWATYTEQARNTRRNRMHTIDGVTRCMAEWCEVIGASWSTVKKRLAAGRDPFVIQRKRSRDVQQLQPQNGASPQINGRGIQSLHEQRAAPDEADENDACPRSLVATTTWSE